MNVKGKTYAVATGNYYTSKAAVRILAKGGNAYDAILAALFMSFVSEPLLSSPGGGGYLLAHPNGEEAQIFDFFAQTPKDISPQNKDFFPIHGDFGDVQQEFHIGKASAAVPGIPAGIFAIHKKYGTLPLQELAEFAISTAYSGYEIEPLYAEILRILRPIIESTPEATAIFENQNRQMYNAGDTFTNPDLALFLKNLTNHSEGWFYQGSPMQSIIKDMQQSNGLLTQQDFHDYQVLVREPLVDNIQDWTIMTNSAPTTGGMLIIEQLKHILKNPNKPDGVRIIEAMMHADRIKNSENIQMQSSKGTTHMSVIDQQGNVASLTVSNGEGCGYVVPESGFMLNNFLGEEDINIGGFFNFQPDSRMISMMSPTILENHHCKIAVGTGGSNRIKTALFQVIYHIFSGKTLSQAVNSPRMHYENDTLDIEKGVSLQKIESLLASFNKVNQWKTRSLFFGGVNAVRSGDCISATGDSRRKGVGIIGFQN